MMQNGFKQKRGRPIYTPTKDDRMKVSIWAACGMQQAFMCSQLINPSTGKPITEKTLEKVFREELDNGMAHANSMVAQSLFKKAIGNAPQNVTAAIFWLKTRAGWKETNITELVGKDGEPLPNGQQTITKAEFEEIANNLLKQI